jgi:signal peptidase II
MDEIRSKRTGIWLKAGILLFTSALFGCDHATKMAAHAALSGGRVIPIYDGIVDLRYVPNTDVAFNLLSRLGIAKTPTILLAVSVVALAAVVVAWIGAARRRVSRMHHVGFALVLAGALGNVVDRAVRGYVVDFIHVGPWPVFNVADAAVCAGVLLLLLARMRSSPPDDRPLSPAAPSG